VKANLIFVLLGMFLAATPVVAGPAEMGQATDYGAFDKCAARIIASGDDALGLGYIACAGALFVSHDCSFSDLLTRDYCVADEEAEIVLWQARMNGLVVLDDLFSQEEYEAYKAQVDEDCQTPFESETYNQCVLRNLRLATLAERYGLVQLGVVGAEQLQETVDDDVAGD